MYLGNSLYVFISLYILPPYRFALSPLIIAEIKMQVKIAYRFYLYVMYVPCIPFFDDDYCCYKRHSKSIYALCFIPFYSLIFSIKNSRRYFHVSILYFLNKNNTHFSAITFSPEPKENKIK